MRIAIGSLFQESNEFVSLPTELDLFRNSYLYERDELFRLAGTNTEVAGMLAVCEEQGASVVPLTAAACVPSGSVSDACYAYLKEAILSPLRDAGAIDGVLLSLHGSMTVISEGDPEGDLLAEVRNIVGPRVPVVATLDLHAFVTPRMVMQATGLVSYTRYPHDDTYTTGERGATLLFDTLHGRVRPIMAMSSVPLVPVGSNGMTFGDGPMAHLTGRAREMEKESDVLSVSCCAVHPNNDQPDLSSTAVVITDNDPDLAADNARSLAVEFWERRHGFVPDILPVADAIEKGRDVDGPVLLVDTADCAGGGAPGDSVAMLRTLLDLDVTERTHVMVVDPDAAATCAEAGIGATVSFALGYHVDRKWGTPLPVTGVVRLVSDGRFLYTGGIYGGTFGMMGRSAVLEIGGTEVLIMSRPTYDWADEQYRSVGLDARQAKFIGVKNPMNYRYAYSGVAKASYVVNTPGPTPADIRRLPFKHRRRPFFPFDENINDLDFPVTLNR